MGRCGSTHKSPDARVVLVAVPPRCALQRRRPWEDQRLGRYADAPAGAPVQRRPHPPTRAGIFSGAFLPLPTLRLPARRESIGPLSHAAFGHGTAWARSGMIGITH